MNNDGKQSNKFIKSVKRIYENGTYAMIKPVAHLVSDRLIDNTESKVKKIVGASIFGAGVAMAVKHAFPADAAARELLSTFDKFSSMYTGVVFGGVYGAVGAFVSKRFISGTKPCNGEVDDSLCLRGYVEKRMARLEKANRTDLLDKLGAKEQKAFDKLQNKQKLKNQNNDR